MDRESDADKSRSKTQPIQISLTIKLILDDVVKNFQQKENQVMVERRGEQKPAAGENLQQVQQFVSGHHRQTLQVRRHWKTAEISRSRKKHKERCMSRFIQISPLTMMVSRQS